MKPSHLLTLFIAFLLVYDQVQIFRLKRRPDPAAKLATYARIMAGLWLATAGAFAIMGRGLWTVQLAPTEASWIPGRAVLLAMVVASLTAMLVPVVAKRNAKAAAAIGRRLNELGYLLPQNARERVWWALLSLTAGICEECVFRSFLFHYLHVDPWRLGIAASLALACVIFALGHLYQGVKAAAATGLLAVMFFGFFLSTGNLLLSIVLHALADLRILLLWPPARVDAERTAQISC